MKIIHSLYSDKIIPKDKLIAIKNILEADKVFADVQANQPTYHFILEKASYEDLEEKK